jgi:hypothetical protein
MRGKLDFRVPVELQSALERERQRMSRKAGVEVPMSAVVRVLVTEALRDRQPVRRRRSSERAA